MPGSYDYDSQYRPSARGRSRASSVTSEQVAQPSQQPLKAAIGNAFEKSDAARVVDPNLIAEITEQVKKSVLEEIKASVAASAQPVPQYVPPSPASTSIFPAAGTLRPNCGKEITVTESYRDTALACR
ncbi:MAG: hypothetical protein EOO01_40350 [Chitinophagaceae bacterium]|nr:MAG: hypothetical protein EOO01_40350 [Chitinophagaceae bacterium]